MRRIERYFPLSHGIARVDDRRIVSAIVFVIKNGLRWRDAPALQTRFFEKLSVPTFRSRLLALSFSRARLLGFDFDCDWRETARPAPWRGRCP